MHNIGKDIVTTVLGIEAFRVMDIGVDNPSPAIIEGAQNTKADIIEADGPEKLGAR